MRFLQAIIFEAFQACAEHCNTKHLDDHLVVPSFFEGSLKTRSFL